MRRHGGSLLARILALVAVVACVAGAAPRSAAPAWKTVLDLDALAAADCESPSSQRRLIFLSEGGEDASTLREFDLASGQFVANGFSLPRAKQTAAWADADTLIVARPWGTNRRYGIGISIHRQGDRILTVRRGISFFHGRQFIVTPAGLRPLDEPWHAGEKTFPAGDLVSVDLAAVTADPQHLKPAVVYAPGPRESLEDVGASRDHLVVTSYANVRGRAAVYTPEANGTWSERSLPVPDDATIELNSADDRGPTAYVVVTRFLTPTTLLQLDTGVATATVVKARQPMFDASRDVVEQNEAVSKDGTRIPYFIVRPKYLVPDGRNPTLINAYGGFGLSQTPFYSGSLGRLWLARSGVFVLANIRGGGEFGPAWHEAGLKTHRQRIYDDFAAVERDLIARKFAAKLAAMKIPYLFYEVTEGGHGAGANITERSFTTALEFTYLTRELFRYST